MSDVKNADPFGDQDPLVLAALEELFNSLGGEWPGRERSVMAIDNLIQARIVIALEALTDAALGDGK